VVLGPCHHLRMCCHRLAVCPGRVLISHQHHGVVGQPHCHLSLCHVVLIPVLAMSGVCWCWALVAIGAWWWRVLIAVRGWWWRALIVVHVTALSVHHCLVATSLSATWHLGMHLDSKQWGGEVVVYSLGWPKTTRR